MYRKKRNRIKQTARGTRDTDKWFSILLPKSYRERRENGSKVIFEETITENFIKIMIGINPWVQES